MEKTALLVIDVQVAMFSYEHAKLYKGNEVLANIKKLVEAARNVQLPVVFIQHTENEEYKKGLPTWEICKEVTPLNNEKVIEKSHCDSFFQTKLQNVLEDLDIQNLIIMGMQSEFCIDTTCRRAFSLGYKCTLVEDAHSTFDSAILTAEQIIHFENQVLGGNAEGRFVKLKSTNEIIHLLNE